MAEFKEVIKQKERICDYVNGKCTNCYLWECSERTCVSFIMEHPQEAEEIIMKWASENPVQTNADKFKEVFGVELDEVEIAEATNACILKCGETKYCEECVKYNFWNKEYKAPKGE